MNPTSADKQISSNEEYYQISDDDDDNDDDEVEEFEDLGDECLLEEVDASGNTVNLPMNSTRGPYERAWTTDATRALIHIRGPLEGRFTEGRQKRTALWLHCTRQLQRLGHRYSAAKVQKKWHNILITYNKNLSKKYSTGYVHWEFFEEMFKYLQGKKADCDQAVYQLAPPPPLTARQPPASVAAVESASDAKPYPSKIHLNNNIDDAAVVPYASQQRKSRTANVESAASQRDKKAEYVDHVDDGVDDDDDEDDDDEDSITLAQLKKPKLDISLTYLPPPPPMEYMHSNGGEYVVDQNSIDARLEQQQQQQHQADTMPPEEAPADWWRHYFERKLQVEREKIQAQRDIHNDLMQFKQSALAQQERVEQLKIDAINGLTAALQRLADMRSRKT